MGVRHALMAVWALAPRFGPLNMTTPNQPSFRLLNVLFEGSWNLFFPTLWMTSDVLSTPVAFQLFARVQHGFGHSGLLPLPTVDSRAAPFVCLVLTSVVATSSCPFSGASLDRCSGYVWTV